MTVLQLNLWRGGTKIPRGIQRVADIAVDEDADILLLQETDGAPERVADELKNRGLGTWNVVCQGSPWPAIVTRLPVVSRDYPHQRVAHAILQAGQRRLSVFSMHGQSECYAPYLPRSYNAGCTSGPYAGWGKRDAAITSEQVLAQVNRDSGRATMCRLIASNAANDAAQGCVIIAGGDLNEPDQWRDEDMATHERNGVARVWESAQEMRASGLEDALTRKYGTEVDTITTWPVGDGTIPTASITETPDADVRDRLDYIFYNPGQAALTGAHLIGPTGTVARRDFVKETPQFLRAVDEQWPSDHRGIVATLAL